MKNTITSTLAVGDKNLSILSKGGVVQDPNKTILLVGPKDITDHRKDLVLSYGDFINSLRGQFGHRYEIIMRAHGTKMEDGSWTLLEEILDTNVPLIHGKIPDNSAQILHAGSGTAQFQIVADNDIYITTGRVKAIVIRSFLFGSMNNLGADDTERIIKEVL